MSNGYHKIGVGLKEQNPTTYTNTDGHAHEVGFEDCVQIESILRVPFA